MGNTCAVYSETCSRASEGHAFVEKATTRFYAFPSILIARSALFESPRDFTRIFSRREKSRVLGRAYTERVAQVLDDSRALNERLTRVDASFGKWEM